MKYRLIIYGNNIYKETIIDESFLGSLTIGTDKACQIAFAREGFLTDFIFRIDKQNDDDFIISCNDTIFLRKDSNLKEYVRKLEFGDHISVCYDKTESDFLYVDFLAYYNYVGTDFDVSIDCSGYNEFTIGGKVDCTIRIDNPYLINDSVRVRRVLNGYEVDLKNIDYGIEINGFVSGEDIGFLNYNEFLSVKGHVFCLNQEAIYTSKTTNIITKLPYKEIKNQNNNYIYPKFVKNVRQRFITPNDKIEVLNPKNKDEVQEQSFLLSVMPMLVNLLLMVGLRGIMGGGGMFVIYFAATMTVSTIVTVINLVREKKRKNEKEEKRQKTYMEYITKCEDDIITLRKREKIVADYMNPSLEQYIKYVDNFDNRLFEKKKDHDDYLKIRLGSGVVLSSCQVEYKKEDYVDTEDELKDFPKALHDKYEYMADMPVCLDLKDVNAVGFIGSRTKLYQINKNIIFEFAASHFFKDVKLFLIMDEMDVELFKWARWLKNTYNDETHMRNFMYDEESAKLTLEFLYSELSKRESDGVYNEDIPDYVVLVYRSKLISNHPVSKYIKKAKELGFRFVFFEEAEEFVNSECSYRIFLDEKDYAGYIQDVNDGEKIQSFIYEHMPLEQAKTLSKKLAGVYVDEVNLENTLTKNISLFQLLNIMTPYDLNLKERWDKSAIYETMAAPIGVKSGDEIVYLDIHEKYHGPHGLVAGTTGSGKSEILQTYILSMATLFHPYEVGFIIIDFKGGGMVNQFRDLPHLNGAITNIDGNEVERSLLSIKAELVKRQELFAEYEVNHIDDYIRAYKDGKTEIPLPHLVLIVDEFAELKSEQPEFMKELISAARIGRSLGVHLILATQKPSGVVSEQIWSNSKFKLCLKVQNKNDSNEVLKSPLAAEIREPGRAYLQVGNNEIFQLFQSAYSGATTRKTGITNEKGFKISEVGLSGKRRIIYEQKPRDDENGDTELKALVNYISEYCESNGIQRLPDICFPTLPDIVPFSYDGFEYNGTDIVVPLGVVDDPSRQRQYVEVVNLSQNNVYILGSTQSGKTNIIQTIIMGLTNIYSPVDVNIYILDFASMILKNFEELNHVAGVITTSNEERLKGFLKLMQETIQLRKNIFSKLGISSYSSYRESGRNDLPQIVVLLDNWIAFRGYYPDYEDTLINICRDSVSVGISVVMTAGQASGIGFKLLANFSKRIALYCNDSSDYGTIFESCRKKIANIAGRGIIENNKSFYEIQYYLAFAAEKEFEKIKLIKEFISEIHNKYGDMYVPGIPEIPEKVTEAFLAKQFGTGYCALYEVPVGMEFNSINKRTLRLDKEFLIPFIGGDESYKRNYIEYLLNRTLSLKNTEPCEWHIVDNMQGNYKAYKELVADYTDTDEGTLNILSNLESLLRKRFEADKNGTYISDNEPLHIVLINSLEIIKLMGTAKEMVSLYKNISSIYRQYKVCFILSDIGNSMITLASGEVLKQVKDGKKAIAFEDIRNIKAVEIPIAASREFKKPLGTNDAYMINGERIEKVRVVCP